MSFPQFGDLWWQACPHQKLSIELLEHLFRANSLIINADPCEYSVIWESLSENERSELKKKGKIEIDVRKPLSDVLQDIRNLIGIQMVEAQNDPAEEEVGIQPHSMETEGLTTLETQMEMLQVDDFGEGTNTTTNQDVSTTSVEDSEIHVLTSSSLSCEYHEIEERAQLAMNERRTQRERRKRTFGDDFTEL